MDVASAVTQAVSGGSGTPARGSTTLSQQEFFQIMITELVNQDPLEPMKNNEFLQQVAQLQTLQTMTDLSQGFESLVLGQQVSSAGTLIGKLVTGVDAVGGPIEGVVDRVLVRDGDVVLGIGSQTLSLAGVSEIKADE